MVDKTLRKIQSYLSVTIILSVIAVNAVIRNAFSLGVTTGSVKWMSLFAFWGLVTICGIVLLGLSVLPSIRGRIRRGTEANVFTKKLSTILTTRGKSINLYQNLFQWVQKFAPSPSIAWFFAGASLIIYPWIELGPYSRFFSAIAVRVFLFWSAAIFGSLSLKYAKRGMLWERALVGISLGMAIVLKSWVFLSVVSSDPFSMGWSEGSRYYYASLYIAPKLYGLNLPLSIWHPSRYLLLSIPFLLGDLPIWVHRLWQSMLWILLPLLCVYALGRRWGIGKADTTMPMRNPGGSVQNGQSRDAISDGVLDHLTSKARSGKRQWGVGSRGKLWVFIFWGMLFFYQGPVYYHLIPAILFVILGFDTTNQRKTLFFVVLASAWAGISRFNWIPVPGMLAAVLYFLEDRSSEKPPSFFRYFTPPAIWILSGSLIGAAAQSLYIIISGNQDVSAFGSSLTSDLLWYRLLPNPSFPLGILTGILLISAPVLLLIINSFKPNPPPWHRLSIFGLASILSVLFLGGLLVSTKIGGGTNLHNMDAYLVALFMIGGYLLTHLKVPTRLAAITLFMPVAFLLLTHETGQDLVRISPGERLMNERLYEEVLKSDLPMNEPLIHELPNRGVLNRMLLDEIQNAIDETSQTGKDVLFISQRHLLTFKIIQNVPLFPKYEKVELMEMAMSGNTEYLDAFYTDLRNQQFSLIISDLHHEDLKGRSAPAGEENDIWVKRVSIPLLTYYQEKDYFPEIGVELLVPK